MKLRQLLVSPPPAAAWLLGRSRVAVARRERGGALHGAVASLADGTVTLGPMGLQAVDGEALGATLEALGGAAEGGRRPAVVIPTSWVRCHLLEVEGVRRRRELDEVVRWRLKKLLPVPPDDLRLAVVPAGGRGGRQRILCVAALERAVAQLEASFAARGMSVGVLAPRLFAVAAEGGGWSLTLELGSEALAAVAAEDGAVRLVRLRALPPGTDLVSAALRELRLLVAYLRDRLEAGGAVAVSVAPDARLDWEPLERWVGGQEGLVWSAPEAPGVPGLELPVASRLALARVLGGAT